MKLSLLALALVTLLLPVAASAQQTFSGGGQILVTRTQTTASSSTLTIAGATGSSIGTLKIILNGVTTDGSNCSDGNCWSMLPTEFYLQAPNGGPTLELLGNTGDAIDGDDGEDSGSGLKNATITIQDGANPAPNSTPWSPQGGPFTVEPSGYFVGNGQTAPLGTATDFPQSDGSATLTTGAHARFTGIGINNGDQWTLTVVNLAGYTTPITVSSWEMVVTYATTTPTSTSVSSNLNPAISTSPSEAEAQLTATVSTSSGTPTGTVAFLDNGSTISGCGAVALGGSQATCSAFFIPGYHNIDAVYSGGGGYGQSSGSFTQLVEVNATQSGNTWCNNTPFSAPLNGTPIAYPAMIPVSGYPRGSTVGNVTLELEGVTEGAAGAGIEAEFLLVAPGGANNLDFLDSAFNTIGTGVNLFISDSATLSPNYGTPVSGDTYLPFDGTVEPFDAFPPSNSPIVDSSIPRVPGTINYAAPYGKTNALTLQQAFSGAPANGDWALYATASNGSDALTVGGWCVTLDVNSGVGTTTSLSSSQQRAYTGNNVNLTATVVVIGTSTPVSSGTVEFKDETTGAVLASANPLNGSGIATVTVSNLAEGDHKILASYSGTGSFNTSFATMYQRIDNATTLTTLSSNQWQLCNTGQITLPMGTSGAETPNPSNIFVSNLPGTLNTATLTLKNFSILVGDQLDNTESLVVGPTGTALDFFSNTADGTIEDTASAGDYTFADAASALVSNGSVTLTPGTYKPTSYQGTAANDVFTADVGGFYTLPGTFGYSATKGTSTFSSEFGGINPNGTWSLYFNSPNANANGTGAAGGWCVDLTENLPTVSVTKAHGGDFSQGQSNAAFTIDIDNNGSNGPTGDPTGTSPMTVTDTLNAAFTYSGFSGTNWNCSAAGQVVTCSNDSAIAQGASYPTLTINVNVASNAPRSVTNSVSVIGAGVASTNSNTDTVMVDQPPSITSTNSATFTVGTAGTFTVTTSGFPTASITETGALPGGVTLIDNGNGTATLSGTPAAATGGVYAFTITASNTASPNATQSFTLTVIQAPAITSANSTTFVAGTAGSFTVTTTGYPKSALSESGTPLPSGITFTDNGNGTATISATAAVNTSGVFPFTITANNGTTNASQAFTLTVNPVLAVLTSPPPGISTVLGATNVAFQWTPGAGVTEYQLNLGTTAPGASNLFSYKGTATTATAAALPADGAKVYARLYSLVNGAWQYNDYLYTESGTPTPAVLTSPTPGVTTVLGTTNVGFQWTAGTAVTEYQLNLSVVAPGQSDLFTYKGTATSAVAPAIPAGGMTVYATLYSLINGAWQSNNYLYTESGSLPAKLTSPTPGLGTILGTTKVAFQWTTGAEVTEYQLSLSAVASGGSDLFLYKGTATSAIAATLPANGVKVYATLYSLINGTWQSNSYSYTESGTPTPATLTSPPPGKSTILGTSGVTFQWTTGVAVTDYQLNLSAITPGDNDLYSYKGTATTATAPTLPANAVEVYARLYSLINGAWQYRDYVYTEGGTPTPAVLTSPAPGLGTVLGTSAVPFQWSAGVGVTDYQLNLSAIAAGDSDLYSYKGTATTATAAALPANGAKVYARLYSLINGAWQYNDYLYTEGGAPSAAALTSPTPGLGTILGTSDVVFQWNAGIGVTEYQLNLSAVAAGGSDLYSYKGTALTATASSLPANGVKVYARLYSKIGGTWQFNDYVYTEQ